MPNVPVERAVPSGRKCLGGYQQKPEYVRLYEKYGRPDQDWVFRSIMGVMRVHHSGCTGKSVSGLKLISAKCKETFQPRNIRKRFEKMSGILSAELAVNRPSISELEIQAVKNILHASEVDMVPARKELMTRGREWLQYLESVHCVKKKLGSQNTQFGAGNDVLGINDFISDFGNLYKNNSDIRGSLLMCMVRSIVSKSSGYMNAPLELVLIDFYLMLASYGTKVFKLVAGNLPGPSWRHMQRISSSSMSERQVFP